MMSSPRFLVGDLGLHVGKAKRHSAVPAALPLRGHWALTTPMAELADMEETSYQSVSEREKTPRRPGGTAAGFNQPNLQEKHWCRHGSY